MNRRVVSFALDGLAKRALRSAQLVLFEINPAETVEIRPVEGVFLQRLLDERLRFVNPYPQIAQLVSVIIQDGCRFRLLRHKSLTMSLHLVEKFRPFLNAPVEAP